MNTYEAVSVLFWRMAGNLCNYGAVLARRLAYNFDYLHGECLRRLIAMAMRENLDD